MNYEDRQLQEVINRERRKPQELAEAFGKDAVILARSTDYFELPMVRLYARIAAHFALDVLQRRGESRMGE